MVPGFLPDRFVSVDRFYPVFPVSSVPSVYSVLSVFRIAGVSGWHAAPADDSLQEVPACHCAGRYRGRRSQWPNRIAMLRVRR